MSNDFNTFLKKHDVYDAYYVALERAKNDVDSGNVFPCFDGDCRMWIIKAFNWDEHTDQGEKHWNIINMKWIDYCRKLDSL